MGVSLLIALLARIQNRGLLQLSSLESIIEKRVPCDRLEKARVPTFVTLSHRVPWRAGVLGWHPEYVRIDGRPREEALSHHHRFSPPGVQRNRVQFIRRHYSLMAAQRCASAGGRQRWINTPGTTSQLC